MLIFRWYSNTNRYLSYLLYKGTHTNTAVVLIRVHLTPVSSNHQYYSKDKSIFYTLYYFITRFQCVCNYSVSTWVHFLREKIRNKFILLVSRYFRFYFVLFLVIFFIFLRITKIMRRGNHDESKRKIRWWIQKLT